MRISKSVEIARNRNSNVTPLTKYRMIDKPTRDKHGPNNTNVQPIIHATQDEVIEIFTLASNLRNLNFSSGTCTSRNLGENRTTQNEFIEQMYEVGVV